MNHRYCTGWKHTDESRRKMSVSQKCQPGCNCGRHDLSGKRQRRKPCLHGCTCGLHRRHSAEHREANSRGLKAAWEQGVFASHSESMRKAWANGRYENRRHVDIVGDKNPMYGRRGDSSATWRGGRTPMRARLAARSEWRIARKNVVRRDKACRLCGSSVRLHVHHIEPFRFAPLLVCEEWNLILLCKKCHEKIAGRERWWRKRLYALAAKESTNVA